MKLALLGKGKTGCEVLKLWNDVTVFDRANPIGAEKLQGFDAIISFLPSAPFEAHLDTLIGSGIPLVSGTTGIDWPKDLNARLKERGVCWVWSFNFSLGMYFVRRMIKTLNDARTIFPDATITIHEVHHEKKLDAPSGTALSWNDLLDKQATITSERIGDVMGHHALQFETSGERISLTHDAKNRSIFAEGAVWTARYLTSEHLLPGLYHLDYILDRALTNKGGFHEAQ